MEIMIFIPAACITSSIYAILLGMGRREYPLGYYSPY